MQHSPCHVVNLMVMCVYKFYVHPEVLLVSSCAICKLVYAVLMIMGDILWKERPLN